MKTFISYNFEDEKFVRLVNYYLKKQPGLTTYCYPAEEELRQRIERQIGKDNDLSEETVSRIFEGKIWREKIGSKIRNCTKFIFFVGSKIGNTHLLINYAYTGNSIQSPVLKIYDMQWASVDKIGEFAGFYEHAIVDRLRDIGGDGNTEIIYVEDSYWPPGKSHAYIVPIYGIAEYRDGRYVNANDKFRKTLERLNDQ